MAVISHTDYRTIALNFAAAKQRLTETDQYLFDSVYTIVQLRETLPEVDLVRPLWDSYQQNSALSTTPQNFLDAVRIVNAHVLSRGGFQDVDSYLEATTLNGDTVSAITVPQEWADMSEAVGYPISNTNVD